MAGLEPKFILKDLSADYTLVILVLRYKGRRINISTGERISPILWDKENQRPTNNKKTLRSLSPIIVRELEILSVRLDEIELYVRNLILDLKKDKAISLETIKEQLIVFFGRNTEQEEKQHVFTIPEFYDNLLFRMSEGKFVTDKGTPYTPGTIKAHRVCRNQIENFGESWGELTFESVSGEFYNQFVAFCNTKGYKPNTIGRAIKSLKLIMRLAYKEGIHTNQIYKDEDFKAFSEDVDNIYLTLEELKAMYELDLSSNKVMERTRDLFLIGCYTAQRFSDYSRFRPEHIKTTANGTKVIDIVTKKTKQRVIIPFLFPELDILLKKYDYSSPKSYEQDLNEQIKKVGERAGIIQNVIIAEKVGGEMKETVYRKCDLIKTHTARRTGATNMFKMGYAPLEIMKVTGHTSEATFLKYIKVSKEENAELMASKISK